MKKRYTYRKWDADWVSGTASMLLEVWDWLQTLGLSQVRSFLASLLVAGAGLFPTQPAAAPLQGDGGRDLD